MSSRTTYESLCATFMGKGCKLLTTETDYNEQHLVKQDKFRYIAKCGHENMVRGTNFLNGSGINCKECAKKVVIEKLRDNNNARKTVKNLCIASTDNGEEELNTTTKRTREVINLFADCVKDNSDIQWELTPDKYSFSDVFIYKNKNEGCVRVHLHHSSREKIRLKLRNTYQKHLIVCLTDNDDAWIIPSSDCDKVRDLAINRRDNTKYAKYKTQRLDIAKHLVMHIHTMCEVHTNNVTKKYANGWSYNDVITKFKENGCTVMTTEEEFNNKNMSTKSLLNVQMVCNHIERCSWMSLNKRKHYKCVTCINTDNASVAFNHDIRVLEACLLESQAFTHISNTISESFNVIKSHEGCLADMIIKPINVIEDAWIGVQLKSRTCLSFNKIGKYPNMVVICVHMPDLNTWIFNGNNLIGKNTISIGKNKSKYSSYEVSEKDLENVLLGFYEVLPKQPLNSLMIPVSACCKKEHENRLYRETLLHEATFQYPKIDGTKYDVIINGFKVQDKCASEERRGQSKYYSVNFGKSNYIRGDNDYYWINMPNKTFYVLPESEILKNKDVFPDSIYLSSAYDKFKYSANTISQVKVLFDR